MDNDQLPDSACKRCFMITFYPDEGNEDHTPEKWGQALVEIGAKYFIFGEEVCPTTGRLHYQGYVEMKKAYYVRVLTAEVKDYMDKGCWLGERRGSQADAIEYCKKDGKVHEWGNKANPGRAREADVGMEILRGGGTLTDVMDQVSGHAWCTYRNGWKEAATLMRSVRPEETPPTVIILVGASGSGKTRLARSEGARPTVWRDPFVSGCLGPKVLFDDFDPETMSRTWFLLLTDRYHQTVEIKGGEATWAPTHIYFTSNHHPTNWKFKCGSMWDQACTRRITEIKEF